MNRLSSVEGLTQRLVEHCMAHNRSKISVGKEVVSISSATRKTSESYTARFILSGYSLDFFEQYAKYARPTIVQSIVTSAKHFYFKWMANIYTESLKHRASHKQGITSITERLMTPEFHMRQMYRNVRKTSRRACRVFVPLYRSKGQAL